MQATKLISIMVLSAVLSTTAGHARSLRDAEQPAEFPPGSYSGKQYVDSRGCVYVRAGYGDAVTWVPRVSRKRQVVCGYKPTFAETPPPALPVIPDPVAPHSQTATAPRPATIPTPAKPAPIAVAAPVALPTPSAPATTVATVQPPADSTPSLPWWRRTPSPGPEPTLLPGPPTVDAPPKPQTVRSVSATLPWWRRQPSPAPAPTLVSSPAVAPVVPVAPVVSAATPPLQTVAVQSVRRLSEACPNASVISKRYIGSGNRYAVRCGPQRDHPGIYGVGPALVRSPQSTAVATAGRRNAATRIPVTTDPASASAIPVAPVQIPAGYKAAWDDGRLNPLRAKGTALGEAQMNLVWTNTVPRRLVQANGGRDVTLAATHQAVIEAGGLTSLSTQSPALQPTAPARVGKARTAAFRYVQVGTFGEPANAQATAARLRQMGLPVRYAKFTSKGRAMKIVLAGPFASQAQLNQALAMARRAGFGDAFFRR